MAPVLCTFTLDDLHFGIDVSRVQEALLARRPTRVPLAPAAVAGLINLRGRILTVIDMRARLDMLPRPPAVEPSVVVVAGAEGPVGLAVDGLGEVLEVGEQTFSPAPGMPAGAARDLISGAHKLEDRLLHVLDLDRVLDLRVGEP